VRSVRAGAPYPFHAAIFGYFSALAFIVLEVRVT